jgi:ubiquinone/menaquinone biosynthesis C-methylase UbiE
VAEFGPVADALRSEVEAFARRTGIPFSAATVETNSGYVERRGLPLIDLIAPGADGFAGTRLLDAGCGFGALSLLFACHGAQVTGIDVNPQRIAVGRAVAERMGLELRFEHALLERLPLPDEAFDVAVVNNALVYVIDREKRRTALAELRRVLRPGGRLVVREANRWHPVDQFTGLPLVHLLPPRRAVAAAGLLGRRRSLVRVSSPPQARRELRSAGFADVRSPGFPGAGRRGPLRALSGFHQITATRPEASG